MRVRLPAYEIHQTLLADELGEKIPWSLADYGVPEAWQITKGLGITICVLDTGVDQEHAAVGDLAGQLLEARDFTGSPNGTHDVNGHGTHVAGTILAAEGNRKGITGVAPGAKLLAGKVLGDEGSGSDYFVSEGIRWGVASGARLFNFSAGSPRWSATIERAVSYALDHGAIVVCAAGNSGGAIHFPARSERTISVGSVNRQRKLSRFSSRGPEQDIAAPGEEILSCYRGGTYAVLSGTSMAAPFVTGLLALALAAGEFDGKILNPATIRDWLQQVAVDEGDEGHDYEYGFGLIDVRRAVPAPKTPAPSPPLPKDPPARQGLSIFIPGGELLG